MQMVCGSSGRALRMLWTELGLGGQEEPGLKGPF